MEAVKVGKRGTIIVPAKLRRRYGIEEGALVTAEAREDGVLIRPRSSSPSNATAPNAKRNFFSPPQQRRRTIGAREERCRSSALLRIRFRIAGPARWTACFSTPTFFSPLLTGPMRAPCSILEAEGCDPLLLSLRPGRGEDQSHRKRAEAQA